VAKIWTFALAIAQAERPIGVHRNAWARCDNHVFVSLVFFYEGAASEAVPGSQLERSAEISPPGEHERSGRIFIARSALLWHPRRVLVPALGASPSKVGPQ
jgi:hypothetical protein